MREAPRDAPEEVKQAYELLERHNWTSEERLAYEKAEIGLMDDLDTIRTAREEEKKEIAIEMIKENFSIDSIHRITKLPLSTIETLKKKNPND